MDAQGTLIIQAVAPEDAGNYSCQATNEVGTDQETVTLYYTGTQATSITSQERGLLPSLPPSRPSVFMEHLSVTYRTGGIAVNHGLCLGGACILKEEAHTGQWGAS